MTLNYLSNYYSDLDRYDEAIYRVEEAVTIYRKIASDNPVHLSDLAIARTNLGRYGRKSGRHTETLEAAREAVTLFRGLAATNPGHRANFAVALHSLGVHQREVGHPNEAIGYAQEAITIYRSLADNPAHLPYIAEALNALGEHHRALGRDNDAIVPIKEAVAIYRDLMATQPAFLPSFADALANLATSYRSLGQADLIDPLWDDTLAALSPDVGAQLLVARAQTAPAGDPSAVGWLIRAWSLVDNGSWNAPDLPGEARRHRAANAVQFDTAWTTATNDLPAWLTVDNDLLTTAQTWVSTPNDTDGCEYLAAHPELLDSAADTAITEALLPLDPQDALRYLDIRTAAQSRGVMAAYRPVLLTRLAHAFIEADPTHQAALLTERHDDLLSDSVRDTIDTLAEDEQSDAAIRANALLSLAETGNAEAAMGAMIHPGRFPHLLDQLALRSDHTVLAQTAILAGTVGTAAEDDPLYATALFYLAVATAADLDRAATLLAQARRLAPELGTTWISRLTAIGQQHPAIMALLTDPLTKPLDDSDN